MKESDILFYDISETFGENYYLSVTTVKSPDYFLQNKLIGKPYYELPTGIESWRVIGLFAVVKIPNHILGKVRSLRYVSIRKFSALYYSHETRTIYKEIPKCKIPPLRLGSDLYKASRYTKYDWENSKTMIGFSAYISGITINYYRDIDDIECYIGEDYLISNHKSTYEKSGSNFIEYIENGTVYFLELYNIRWVEEKDFDIKDYENISILYDLIKYTDTNKIPRKIEKFNPKIIRIPIHRSKVFFEENSRTGKYSHILRPCDYVFWFVRDSMGRLPMGKLRIRSVPYQRTYDFLKIKSYSDD